jgi:hypothetical protein
MRFRWLLPAWLLLTAALVLPQVAYYASGSTVLAILAAVPPLGLLAWLLLHFAATLTGAAVGLGVAVTLAGLTGGIGTSHFQAAALLAAGKSLDGVTLADALRLGEQRMWVRLTDARVRSESTHSLTFVSGGETRQGQVSTPTHETYVLAPVTLATDVDLEDPTMRRDPSGPIQLWACAGDIFKISDWDRERQAVRGTLTRIEDHVLASLQRELSPPAATPIPGAGAIPAAGQPAMPGMPDFFGGAALPPSKHAALAALAAPPLSIAADPWCVHLDRTLDAAAAKSDAVGTALVFLIMLPLFALGVLAICMIPAEKPR